MPIRAILFVNEDMVTCDESGVVIVWDTTNFLRLQVRPRSAGPRWHRSLTCAPS